MKILVTGATGMLGRAVYARFGMERDVELVRLCRARGGDGFIKADLTDVDAIAGLLDRLRPDVIVHTAAIRDPDEFASDTGAARKLNVDATGALARWTAARDGAFLVYISSDYVFNGTKAPYGVDDPVAPANGYGASKADGEAAVRAACADRAAILRVPILWGDVETLAESSVTKVLATVLARKPAVLDDWAVRYPTCVADVADVLAQIVRRRLAGTFHWSHTEALTKYDMAVVNAELAGVDAALFTRSGAPANGSEPRPKDCHLDRARLEALGVTTQGTAYRDQIRRLLGRFAAFALLFAGLGASGAGLTLEVSPAGDDAAAGTAGAPLRTLRAARDRVRAARAAGTLAADARAEIVLKDGDHALGATLELGARDGAVTWRAEHPGRARVTRAVRVPAAQFGPVTDAAVRARLPEAARGKVVQADVSGLVPGAIPPMATHFGGTPTAPLLFANHAHGTLARWPNDGFTSFTRAVDKGTGTGGAFVYEDPRAARWDFAAGVWMNGYWTHDWDNHSVRAAGYGTENGTNGVVRLACAVPYGVMAGTWGRKQRRFYVFNLPEELDAPGEWWLDRARKMLYWYPVNGTVGAADEVFLALDGGPAVRATQVTDLRIEGLVFEYGFGSALVLSGVRIAVTGCRIGNFGGKGVSLTADASRVADCELFNLGEAGITVSGGDRRTLRRADTAVERCHVHHWALYKRTYAPAVGVGGCGVTVRGNEMHDAPHSAVLYGGNEHLFESNDVHHVLLETGDAGAYYTGRDWTTMGNVLRHNYTHELGAEGELANTMGFYFDDCDCGDAVYSNVFWRVSRGIMIGGGREHPVRGNVFAECQIGMSIDCRGMTWKHWNNPAHGESWLLEKKALALDYTNGVWAAAYPRLAKIMQDHPREPLYNPVEDNVFIDCTRQLIALDQAATPILARLAPIRNNLAVNTTGTNGVRRAAPDARLAAGFTVINGTPENPVDVGRWMKGVAGAAE